MARAKENITMAAVERNIRFLIDEMGQYEAILPDGELSPEFILSYITQHNAIAAQERKKIVRAYEKLKTSHPFIKGMYSRKVDEQVLKKIILFQDYLVRPSKVIAPLQNRCAYTGIILKLPELLRGSEYPEGDEWKKLIEKGSDFKVGDKIIYSYRNHIVVNNELLDLVSMPVGKVIS